MIFKLRTSNKTAGIFENIGMSTNLQPFALSKIAIALSIFCDKELEENDFNTDNDGLELNRQTITGDHDNLFRAVIIYGCRHSISEEEYFPKYLKAHLDRGAKLLDQEFRYNSKNFFNHLCELNEGI